MPGPAESLKAQSNRLRGPIAEDLQNDLPEFSKPSVGLLKFHGIYQQDDRDQRKTGPKQFSMMIRVGIPGGVLDADQYLTLDRLAGEVGDGSLRITSRQDIQYHYVGKRDLKQLIQTLNTIQLSSLAACGDVVRNVIACAAPIQNPARQDLRPYILQLARELKPKTHAYWEIWLDGEKAATLEEEPLYGEAYLPRKFKIAFAYPGENTTDIYSNDIGVVPHFADGRLEGFTILAGGGMGQSNGVKASHPRLADPIGFVEPGDLLAICKAIITIHRDFGNRENRKLARLKYVLDAWGVNKFRAELEARFGKPLAPPRELVWHRSQDYLGWHEQGDGLWFLGLRVISGRVNGSIREGIREVVERFRTGVHLTAQQNLMFTNVRAEDRSAIDAILAAHQIPQAAALPPVLRHSMSCPALPTCGQALTEAERIFPAIAQQVQHEFDHLGLGTHEIQVRMTGCPNGCARPYTAEIGIVGMSVDLYTIYLGGSPLNTRLAQVYKHGIKSADVGATIRPVLASYAQHRALGESFGDFVARHGWEAAAQEVA
jgi:sulfite reductase (ferredoxin)